MSENKPDLMAELAEVVRLSKSATPNDMYAMGRIMGFVLTRHAELEAVVRDAIPAPELVKLLPGVYYMDPPDGGDVSLMEQFRRMAKDASRYRHIKFAPPTHYHFGCGEALDAAIDHAMHNSAREGL